MSLKAALAVCRITTRGHRNVCVRVRRMRRGLVNRKLRHPRRNRIPNLRNAHQHEVRGSSGTLRRRGALLCICAVGIGAAITLPDQAASLEPTVDTDLQRRARSEVATHLYTPKVQLTDTDFELLPVHRVYKTNENVTASDTLNLLPGTKYFARANATRGLASNANLIFAIEDQPDLDAYQFCHAKRDICRPLQVAIDATSGHLYLRADMNNDNVGHQGLTAYVADFPTQSIELSATEGTAGYKVYRDAVVNPTSRASDCSEYPPETRTHFGCKLLREYLPDEPPTTSSALRDALPNDLVQPKENYRLVFAEEFETASLPSPSGECHTGLAGISDNFHVQLDPCTNRDISPQRVPCMEVENGYLYMTKTTTCKSSASTTGKMHFKYGYWEVQYEIEAHHYAGAYLNHAVVAGLFGDLIHSHSRYRIELESEEDLLRFVEQEIDLIENLPTYRPRAEISHQYYNTRKELSGYDSVRSTKVLNFCYSDGRRLTILVAPPRCGRRGETFVVTRGVEWTPQGYISFYRVQGDPNSNTALVPLRRSNINLEFGKARGWEHGLMCESMESKYLVPAKATDDDDPVVFEQVAVGHVPVSIGLATHGGTPTTTVTGKFRIHYMRLFQPQNGYSDMEPAFAKLPLEQEVSQDRVGCQTFETR